MYTNVIIKLLYKKINNNKNKSHGSIIYIIQNVRFVYCKILFQNYIYIYELKIKTLLFQYIYIYINWASVAQKITRKCTFFKEKLSIIYKHNK